MTSGPPTFHCPVQSDALTFLTRRLLGRNFSEPTLQTEISLLPYKVVERDGRPDIKVQINGIDKFYSIEEVMAEMITRLKRIAESYVFDKVTCAAITAPAYYTDNRRQAMQDAATIAGLKFCRIFDEPKAAGVGYKFDEIGLREQNE